MTLAPLAPMQDDDVISEISPTRELKNLSTNFTIMSADITCASQH